jgi:hypothetical protein
LRGELKKHGMAWHGFGLDFGKISTSSGGMNE